MNSPYVGNIILLISAIIAIRTYKDINLVNVESSLSSEEELIQGDIINIFSEGRDEEYGRSLINILNLLEFIA